MLYNFFLTYPVIYVIRGLQYTRTLFTQKLDFDAISRESGFFSERNVYPNYVLARSRFCEPCANRTQIAPSPRTFWRQDSRRIDRGRQKMLRACRPEAKLESVSLVLVAP